MKKFFPLTLVALLIQGNVFAQTSGVIYRYKDASGKTIYSDSMPPQVKTNVDMLSPKTGVLTKVLERQITEEEAIEKNKQDQEVVSQKKKEQDKLRQDQVLLNTYSSVKEIQDMKKYDLDQLDRAIQNDINNMASLMDKKSGLEKDLESNPKANQNAKEELKRVNDNLDNIKTNLNKNKEMYNQKEAKYNNDIKRFEELQKELSAKKQ